MKAQRRWRWGGGSSAPLEGGGGSSTATVVDSSPPRRFHDDNGAVPLDPHSLDNPAAHPPVIAASFWDAPTAMALQPRPLCQIFWRGEGNMAADVVC